MDESYELLRYLTSPVVAITSLRDGKKNGMIANSAMRASLSSVKPRVSVVIHKFNHSHDMIFGTGLFAMHLLHADQLHTVYQLGFQSGRDRDKLAEIPHHTGKLGLPVLDDCFAYFECRVINVMDTGPSTCFLGAVEESGRGVGEDVMTSEQMRSAMSPEWRERYLRDLAQAQEFATEKADEIRAVVWPGLT